VPADTRPRGATNLEELIARGENQRWLSVVVRLKVESDQKKGVTADAIRAAQDALQKGLSGTPFRAKRLFRHVPYATLEADRSALRRLATVEVVAGVSEEAEYVPLHDTTPYDNSAVVDASWSFKQAFSGRGAAVAILDGGTARHAYFVDRLVEEFCFSSSSSGVRSLCRGGASEDSGAGSACAFPAYCDHGTHVAGIAAGDSASRSGIARGADIVAINVSVEKADFILGPYQTLLNGDVVAALEKVLDLTSERNVAAVNMSFGTYQSSEGTCDGASENERAVKAVVDLLRQKGVAPASSDKRKPATRESGGCGRSAQLRRANGADNRVPRLAELPTRASEERASVGGRARRSRRASLSTNRGSDGEGRRALDRGARSSRR
jgi:subtilisin family serine protease